MRVKETSNKLSLIAEYINAKKQAEKQREALIDEKIMIPHGKYNPSGDFIKTEQAEHDTLKQQDIKKMGFFEIGKDDIKTLGIENIIFRGDSVKLLINPTKRNGFTKPILRSGGFVRTLHPEDGYIVCLNAYGVSCCFQIDEIGKLFVKPLGKVRPKKLQALLNDEEYIEEKEPPKPKIPVKKEKKIVMLSDKIKDELYKYYYTKKNYVGRDKLYAIMRKNGVQITKSQVADWLSRQSINQLTRQIKTTGVVKPIVPTKPYSHLQMDLIDMNKWTRGTKTQSKEPFRYMLNIVDLYSKKAWSYPIKHKNENNVKSALNKFYSEVEETPKMIQADNGAEWKDYLKPFLLEKGTKLTHSLPYKSDSNGGIERYNQTIQHMLHKHFLMEGNRNWVKILPTFVKNYNNMPHGSTKQIPNEVVGKTKQIDNELIKHAKERRNYVNKNNLQVGDLVRTKNVKKNKLVNVEPNWSDKKLTIKKIVKPQNKLHEMYYILSDKTQRYANDLLKIPTE